MKKGFLLIISGPSGAGKGTVVSKLVENDDFALSISATTRAPRDGEIENVSYFYKTVEQFEQMISNNEFLEYAKYCDQYYGTPLPYVEKMLAMGKNVILEIDVQGAFQVKEKYQDSVLIFLAPPSLEELEARLRGRKSETEAKIKERLETAARELDLVDDYDYLVVNNTVDEAVDDICAIVKAEHHRAARNKNIKNTIKGV